MKILHIITGLSEGGAEAVLYRLVLHDTGNVHHVVSLAGGGRYGQAFAQHGIEVTVLDMPRGRVTVGGIQKLRRTIALFGPDLVQTWMYHADWIGGVVARLCGYRCVVWNIRNSTLEQGAKRSTKVVVKLCAWLSRFVPQKIISCAKRAVDVHVASGYSKEKFIVISNGYDLTQFLPDEGKRKAFRSELGVVDAIPLIGMVGRFDPQKDHRNLLEALGILTKEWVEFSLVLVGQNMTWENELLVSWIKQYELQDRTVLLGSRNDIPVVMNGLDLHLLSSSYGEAFPNVLCEAMACGTPCVSTDVGDASIIVGDTGWVVPPQHATMLAQSIKEALLERREQPDTYQDRRVAARNRILDQFGINKMIEKYTNVWTNCLCAE